MKALINWRFGLLSGLQGLLLTMMLSSSLLASDVGPEKMVRDTTAIILARISAERSLIEADNSRLYKMVDEIVLPHFDFAGMTRLAVGKYWRKLKVGDRTALVQQFRHLLVRTYGRALLEYTDQELIYLPMRGSVAKGRVTVRTEVDQGGGFPIPINYKLTNASGAWKVYDVSIDDVSLVTNYRSSFSRTIRSEGVASLIKQLSAKNKDAR